MRSKTFAGRFRGAVLPALSLAIGYLAASIEPAAASADFSSVASNINTSTTSLPGLITALAYGLGLMLGVQGIVKLKDHVDTPNQTPLRTGIIRLLVGGALFALPIVYEAMYNSIGNQAVFANEQTGGALTFWGALGPANNLNDVLVNVETSTQWIPGLLTSCAYLIGLLFGVAGLMKAREHVEQPEQTTLKEPVIRLLAGGALFALPTVMQAAQQSIDGNGGVLDELLLMVVPSNFLAINQGASATCTAPGWTFFGNAGVANGVGQTICNMTNSSTFIPALTSAFAYLFAVVLTIWGILKIKDNVINPQQTSIWEGVSRLAAAGGFFALPYMIEVATTTISGFLGAGNSFTNTGFNGAPTGAGLDEMMVKFTGDIFGPMLFTLNLFGYAVGVILLVIGISRLLKSAQEGPRGPGGIGTIMTFIGAGAMLSLSPLIGAFSHSEFGGAAYKTQSSIMYTTGMNPVEIAHVEAVISAVLQFMIILGVVAFLRGIYIIREVAEGRGQASLMAGITHMVGGSLAVNLGPVMNAAQNTLGLGAYGVNFF
jgi:hypothetical protein